MAAIESHLAGLPEEKRRELKAWREQFERAWDAEQLRAWLGRLPPSGDPLRLPMLIELVSADLQHRRDRGDRVVLASYLNLFAELETTDPTAADLIRAEYAQRFQHQADVILNLIEQSQTSGGSPASPGPAGELRGAFGRYEIKRKLGACGMGTVYLAHDGELRRDVALKVPHLAPADSVARERFDREAKAAAALGHHPHLCPVYDAGTIDGVRYFTMMYVAGVPLSDWLKAGKPSSPRRSVGLVRKIAAALQYCHDRGFIHRDLKPSNVMIQHPEDEDRAEPMVIDFGIAARVQPGDPRLTAENQFVGTLAYMAPELFRGGPPTPASDIYSLGVILYQLLAGRLPFDGSEVIGQAVFQEPEPPSQFRPDVPPHLEAVCLKAMEKNPAERYASMGEFAQALAAGRGWRKVLVGAALGVLALVAVAFALSGGRPVPPPPPPAPLALQWSGFAQGQRGGVWADLQFKDGVTLFSGEEYKLVLCPSEECHLYVIGVDGTGPSLLFPHERIPLRNPVRGKAECELPAGRNWYELDPTPGPETLYFVASREPLPDLEGHVRARAVERLDGLVRELEKKSAEQVQTRGQTVQPSRRVAAADLKSGRVEQVMDVALGGDVVVKRVRFEHKAGKP